MERAYTVKEIDDLRRACDDKYLYGSFSLSNIVSGGCSRTYREGEKAVAVEAMVRTYMLAGLTAQDLYESERHTEAVNE